MSLEVRCAQAAEAPPLVDTLDERGLRISVLLGDAFRPPPGRGIRKFGHPRVTSHTDGAPTHAQPSIAASTALNLVGLVAPLIAAVAAFPILNRTLGTERVGFLTLAWALVGYFSLFDLGIGRALTKLVAEKLAASDVETLPRLVWTGLALMLGLGVIAALVIALGARWLVESALKIPFALQPEAVTAVRVLAWAVPLVVTSAGLRGVLEAQGRFVITNAVRAPMGVWLIVGPLLVVPFGSRNLAWVAGILVAGRFAAWVAYAVACVRGLPGLRDRFTLDVRDVGPLLRFGGWMTVSNVISPLMVYMDRFFLGSRVSLEAVAWYATPWEVVTKVLVIPGAAVAVLFPMFSSLAEGKAALLYSRAVRYLGLVLFLPMFAVALFAREGLELWLGAEFASHAYRVAQLIALGSLLNGIAHVPFALVQGVGRPDLTARIHLLELPIYVALVLWLTTAFGIEGTAIAWCIRMALDLAALHLVARREAGLSLLPGARSYAVAAAALGLFATAFAPLPLLGRILLFTVVAAAELFLVWEVFLESDGLGHLKARVANALILPWKAK
jgi:O-antigen/teichoic acid export membrane protein